MTAFFDSLRELLKNLPKDWIDLTTHRLDIYNESEAKSEFIQRLKQLILKNDYSTESLQQLPTAYDYIRLGHQLSSVLEWALAKINKLPEPQVITFASKTMPILALLRTNLLSNKSTYIYYDGDTSPLIDEPRLHQVYGYKFQLNKINDLLDVPKHPDAMVVFVTQQPYKTQFIEPNHIDVTINLHPSNGAVMLIHSTSFKTIVKQVQHVRRRETIAMSPLNCLASLNELVGNNSTPVPANKVALEVVSESIKQNTGSEFNPLIGSSGLSIQYAILMGLVETALVNHPNKPIMIILPPNCYGGTNDQSRRVADLIANVSIVDLLVDGGEDLVNSLEVALTAVAQADGVPIVLAEIPTNPRVEVPDMKLLGKVLSAKRVTANKEAAIAPIFMVDQTFCPNVKLLDHQSELRLVKTISFSSGSKFPSGGRCIAGYCASNLAAKYLMDLISKHLILSDNEADSNQLKTLAETMPSMPQRIQQAFEKTRKFVNYIKELIPSAKIYYVTDEIAQQGFMPSVFSLDLPVKGDNIKQKHEAQKKLNKKLIEFMIKTHPLDCKNCVSYGQLKGSYWTIPATSTQGTTKEDDKDYVVRVALSPDSNLELLIQSFKKFCSDLKLI
jgi:cystathionine beta-lyase/cystathionine gamma-synthase